MGEEEDYTLADTVASSENLEDDVIRKVDRERMRKGVQEEIERLPKEQAEVIRHRVIERKSLEETGKQIGRYRDAVNMLQRRAMRILTLPDRCGKYRSYYEEYLAPAAVHHVGVKRLQETWTSEVEREVLGW